MAQCFHFPSGYLLFMKHKSTQILIYRYIKKAIDIADTITLLSLNCEYYFFSSSSDSCICLPSVTYVSIPHSSLFHWPEVSQTQLYKQGRWVLMSPSILNMECNYL